jgi:hypothetical protein
MNFVSGFRKLNDEGLRRFTERLLSNATGATPAGLLTDPETSDALPVVIRPEQRIFRDRFEFGQYLGTLLNALDVGSISHDRGLWSALALFWFDQLCPPNNAGQRKVEKEYRYVLSHDFRHFYRHLVRSPWQLVRDHHQNAKFLLLAPGDAPHPLRRHGEILEQLGGRQAVLRSRPVIAEASRLYSDVKTGRPLRGVSGSGRGSVRRLALVLQQFDLTFDSDSMHKGNLLKLLPAEFDRWKAHLPQQDDAKDAGSRPDDAEILVIGG